jgi:hypothetical protein
MPDTDPGQSNQATVELAPGNGVIFSVSMGDMADPTPDWPKGGLKQFTVTEDLTNAPAPQADFVSTVGSDEVDVPAELSAAKHTVQVVNASGQEDGWVFFLKLGDDTMVENILAAFEAVFAGQQPETMPHFSAVAGSQLSDNIAKRKWLYFMGRTVSMQRLSRTTALKLAAVISILSNLQGYSLFIPLLARGSTTLEPPPYFVVVLGNLLLTVATVAAYGVWYNQRWGIVLTLLAVSINTIMAVPGILFAPTQTLWLSAIISTVFGIVIIVLCLWRDGSAEAV